MAFKQTFKKIKDFVCCVPRPKYPQPYEFIIDTAHQPHANKVQFESNFVRTSKYSIISFLPKALILQFTRLANVYFLIIAILLTIDIISPLNPFTAWAPLLIVIGISMTRQGYEDFQRYKSDRKLNYNSFARIVRNGQQHNVKWSQILVGDICIVGNDQTFPADLILLTSSYPNGTAFIQTASLDGQKNLKPRNAFRQTLGLTLQQMKNIKGKFTGPVPDPQLHRFSATMIINNQTMYIQGDKQLLYRGTKLRNTQLIYGLVIYTGKNTKIMKNSQVPAKNKMSQVQRKVNIILGAVLTLQAIFCFIVSGIYMIFRNQIGDSYYYVDWLPYSSGKDAVIIYFTYLILLNTMIPISLIVSIQIVKMFQKYFIDRDKFMFSQWRKIGVNVKSASLNQELGQIQYIFSDKTGTLTKNIMQFKIAAIQKQLYGDLSLIAPRAASQRQPQQYGFHDSNLKDLLQKGTDDRPLNQPIIIKNIEGQQKLKLTTLRQVANQYFMALSLAHQVIVQKKDDKSFYQGPSPDQISLVDAAKQMNYEFIDSTQHTTTLKIFGRQTKFQLLGIFPFTSDRKRMSVVVRQLKQNGNLIRMYTKGADNIIKERLATDNHLNLDQELNNFSVVGLRTLLIAMRIISQNQWKNFQQQMTKLPVQNRDKAIDELQSTLQNNFYLIGATAVLDRLQDQVPQTIRDLIRANIKLWMLTGDKMQTAQNIAKSCNLIQPQFRVLRYRPQLARVSGQQFSTQNYLQQILTQAKQLRTIGLKKALLIQGADLNQIIESQPNQKLLVQLGQNCQSVVCCRLLPSQKRQIVRMVRKHLKKITLSIGDGANDVAMIKQAHIGIGLYGQQGMGAVQASDYALPQFRMLWRLLLVHGRWNYIRISQMILYFFYKNMLFTIPQFITAFFCAYSGQTIFDDVYIALYNLIFTALPVVVRAVLEQDVNYMFKEKQIYGQFPQIAGKNMKDQQHKLPQRYHVNKYFYRLFPKIYFIGQDNCVFNYTNYFAWLFEGMLEATLLTTITFYILGDVALNGLGISTSFWLVGQIIYTSVIFIVTFKLCTHTRFWSALLIWVIILTSLGLYLAYMWISNWALASSFLGVAYIAWTSAQCYFIVLFSVCMILFVDGLIVFLDFRKGALASKMRQIVHEQQINNRQYYDMQSVTITSGLTVSSYKAPSQIRR